MAFGQLLNYVIHLTLKNNALKHKLSLTCYYKKCLMKPLRDKRSKNLLFMIAIFSTVYSAKSCLQNKNALVLLLNKDPKSISYEDVIKSLTPFRSGYYSKIEEIPKKFTPRTHLIEEIVESEDPQQIVKLMNVFNNIIIQKNRSVLIPTEDLTTHLTEDLAETSNKKLPLNKKIEKDMKNIILQILYKAAVKMACENNQLKNEIKNILYYKITIAILCISLFILGSIQVYSH